MVAAHFDNIRKILIQEIQDAQNEILVAVYWFTNIELFNVLLDKVRKGVKVKLIIHNDYINNRESGLPFQSLIDEGGEFYFSNSNNPMHNKFCVIDKTTLINGSYNWTYYAEEKNSENILVIKQERTVIEAFVREFDKLKNMFEKVQDIATLTKFEVDEFNNLNARNYLANDIVNQASETNNKEIVEHAFKIAPDNIEVQKKALALNLTQKRRLKFSIGSSLQYDRYLIIVPKGEIIPVSMTKIVQTSEDNQVSSHATIHYGENPKASRNKSLADIEVYGLPRKPKGEAKIKYNFTIDIYGNLRMEKYSLDNGRKSVVNKIITGLLEEIPDEGENTEGLV